MVCFFFWKLRYSNRTVTSIRTVMVCNIESIVHYCPRRLIFQMQVIMLTSFISLNNSLGTFYIVINNERWKFFHSLDLLLICRCIHLLSPELIHLVYWSRYQWLDIMTLAHSLYYHKNAWKEHFTWKKWQMQCIPEKHKSQHNRQKIGEMP